MIQANELRIGNYYHEYAKLNDLGTKTIVREFQKVKKLDESQNIIGEGIVLTPEILEKCGFILLKDGWFEIDMFEGARKLSVNISDGWAIGDSDYVREVVFKGELCLHQLQNLYLALTGKELDVSGLK